MTRGLTKLDMCCGIGDIGDNFMPFSSWGRDYLTISSDTFRGTLYNQEYWKYVIKKRSKDSLMKRYFWRHQFKQFEINGNKVILYTTITPNHYVQGTGRLKIRQKFTVAIECRPYLHDTYYISVKLRKSVLEPFVAKHDQANLYWKLNKRLKGRHCKILYNKDKQPILYYKYDTPYGYGDAFSEEVFDKIAFVLSDLQGLVNYYLIRDVWADAVQNNITKQFHMDYDDLIIAERMDK